MPQSHLAIGVEGNLNVASHFHEAVIASGQICQNLHLLPDKLDSGSARIGVRDGV